MKYYERFGALQFVASQFQVELGVEEFHTGMTQKEFGFVPYFRYVIDGEEQFFEGCNISSEINRAYKFDMEHYTGNRTLRKKTWSSICSCLGKKGILQKEDIMDSKAV